MDLDVLEPIPMNTKGGLYWDRWIDGQTDSQTALYTLVSFVQSATAKISNFSIYALSVYVCDQDSINRSFEILTNSMLNF
jgi:hypothetical protein